MSDIVLLDGGMGQELVRRAGDSPKALWATAVMMARPGLVAEVHGDYFAAGARIATTNNYAIHRDRLERAGLEDRFEALHAAALEEAHRARARHQAAQKAGRKSGLEAGLQAREEAGLASGHEAGLEPGPGAVRIAGSIGPLGATYRPEVHPPHSEAVALYREVAALIAPGVDLLLCETIASLAHARAVLEGALGQGRPVWLSVTVDDEDGTRLRSGEPVAGLVPIARDGAAAVLANCSAPEAMPAALDALALTGLPFGAYANGFTRITKEFLREAPTVDVLSTRRDMGPEPYAEHALRWVAQGATIVGGCCETGPEHIRHLAARLRAAGHRLVAAPPSPLAPCGPTPVCP